MNDFEDLADSVIDVLGEPVEVRVPTEGPLDGMTGRRDTTYTVVRVQGSVGRSNTESNGPTIVQVIRVSLRKYDVPFEITDKCEIRIVGRDNQDTWRQVAPPETVVAGTMWELVTRLKK